MNHFERALFSVLVVAAVMALAYVARLGWEMAG